MSVNRGKSELADGGQNDAFDPQRKVANKKRPKCKYRLFYGNSFSFWLLSCRSPNAEGSKSKSQQPKMIKSASALAIFLLLGASVVALPFFAPKAAAGEVAALAKGDRLEVRA